MAGDSHGDETREEPQAQEYLGHEQAVQEQPRVKTGGIIYEFETKTFNYDRGIKPLADVIDVDGAAAPQAPSNALIRPRPAHPP